MCCSALQCVAVCFAVCAAVCVAVCVAVRVVLCVAVCVAMCVALTFEWGKKAFIPATGSRSLLLSPRPWKLRMSHVAHTNELCCAHEWVMSLVWMSRVTYLNESCH